MLQVIGEVGKSVIADAIKKYNNARIYVYDKEEILTLDSIFTSSNFFSVDEFYENICKDIKAQKCEYPANTIILYTNSPDINIITDIKAYANTLEEKCMVGTVITMTRM